MPVCRYTGKVENRQTVTIKDTKDGSTHLVTLETMAKDNVYAKELLEISYRRTWSGKVFTEDLFSYIKVVDDRVYIICSVYNWNGETFAVEFNYDFSLDKVYYLSSYKVGGIVSGNYAIAPHS